MATAKLADVKVMLSVVYAELRSRSRRKGTLEAQVVCLTAHRKFDERSTPATWSRLVAASQQLGAVAKPSGTRTGSRRPPQTREGRPDGLTRALGE